MSGVGGKADIRSRSLQVRVCQRDSRSGSSRGQSRRDAEDALSEAETEVFEARSALDSAAARRRTGGAAGADIDAARAAVARAQERRQARAAALGKIEADGPLPSQSEAQLTNARAQRAAARAAVDKMTIRAPLAGTVLQVNVNAGETAAPSSAQPLMLIADVSILIVRAELDERDVAGVRVRQPVVVRAAAFAGRDFPGKVASVAPLAEPARIKAREAHSLSDFDVVEARIDLERAGPLTSGMKVDVFFRRSETAQQQ
jgi:HlyD family secretion protein